MKYLFLLVVFIISSTVSIAQNLKQTVRGKVQLFGTEAPIDEALIVAISGNDSFYAKSTVNGEYILEKIPVGRVNIICIKEGFKSFFANGLLVSSGKESIVNINLDEDVNAKIVTVSARSTKGKTVNEMALVSGRQFTVEETQRYAAAINDPARLATSFAGVSAPMDGNNYISVRGNSPNAVLWRMEGIDIPNPNHFSDAGTAGGGITILSAQLLANSDFFTAAFPAEYGNVIGGVFDLKLRKGNEKKRETTLQAGFLGLDVATEGPFSKKKSKGSYLINYRYSTLTILTKLGVPLGSDITNFQDLSYHFNYQLSNKTSLKIFGFSGLSSSNLFAIKDSSKRKFKYEGYDFLFGSNTNLLGISLQHKPNRKLMIQTNLNGSYQINYDKGINRVIYNQPFEKFNITNKNLRITLSEIWNYKISTSTLLRAGVTFNTFNMQLKNKERDSTEPFKIYYEQNGSTNLIQTFIQGKTNFNNRLTAVYGLHFSQLFLNNTNSIEPRLSVKYRLGKSLWLSGAAGKHSQLQTFTTYFFKNKLGELLNKNLDYNKAIHVVIGVEKMFNNWRIKSELYHQNLYHLPISTDINSAYCTINEYRGFAPIQLINKGVGKNTGVELTIERFLQNGFYFLSSISFFDSKYKTLQNIWHNTRFNTNKNITITTGKEFKLKADGKKVFGINMRMIYVGGLRETPIKLTESIAFGKTVYDELNAFKKQIPNYFRLDIKFLLRTNKQKHSSILSLDIQNASNHKNIQGYYFDLEAKATKTWYQTPLIPILSYKVEL